MKLLVLLAQTGSRVVKGAGLRKEPTLQIVMA